jgi:hypothetical protein
MQLNIVIVPADGISAANVESGNFGSSPLFLGSSQTSSCLSVSVYVAHQTQNTIGV